MTSLSDSSIPHLAFRVDRCLSCRTRNEVGSVVLARDESPVSALANLAKDRASVLIVDQIDAVSEISGRTGAIKDILLELVPGNSVLRGRQMSSGVPQLRSGERSSIPRAGTEIQGQAGASRASIMGK